jgi:hypothetical protein
MAVVDTAFVGRLPGAEALGGLAVATSIFSFTFFLFNFLSTVRDSGGQFTTPALASKVVHAHTVHINSNTVRISSHKFTY